MKMPKRLKVVDHSGQMVQLVTVKSGAIQVYAIPEAPEAEVEGVALEFFDATDMGTIGSILTASGGRLPVCVFPPAIEPKVSGYARIAYEAQEAINLVLNFMVQPDPFMTGKTVYKVDVYRYSGADYSGEQIASETVTLEWTGSQFQRQLVLVPLQGIQIYDLVTVTVTRVVDDPLDDWAQDSYLVDGYFVGQ